MSMNEKKRGRPVTVQEPKNRSIICLCSLADKNKIIRKAKEKGQTVSAFVYDCVMQFI